MEVMGDCKLFIDGSWREGGLGKSIEVINPYNEEFLYKVAEASSRDISDCLSSASRGLEAWSKVLPWDRAALLDKIASLMSARVKEIGKIISLEVGKPIAQAEAEASVSCEQFSWYAGEARRLSGIRMGSRMGGYWETSYNPVGVVAALTPWNFPSVLVARKIAPALAAGCSVIVSPSELTPKSAAILVEICHDAGLPKGVIQLLTGKPEDVSKPLLESRIVRKISFTGSTSVGKMIMRESSSTLKRVTLELGGHAPVIVDNTVDASNVAKVCATGKYRNSGQVCVSPTRFYVHEDSYQEFTESFIEYASSLSLGDPMDKNTGMGPMISEKQRSSVEQLVKRTIDEGATLRCGGGRPRDINRGYFFEPTVFTDVSDDATIMREEPFGPVAPIVSFKDREEVLDRANSTCYGLAGFVMTGDVGFADYFKTGLEVGMVGVNSTTVGTAEAPFGGINDSGFGEEGGINALYAYLSNKTYHVLSSGQ